MFLDNLLIRTKLLLPIIIQLLLVGVVIYFYFSSSALIEQEEKKRQIIAATYGQVREFAYPAEDYIGGRLSFEQVMRRHQEIVEALRHQPVFADAGATTLFARIGEELRAVETRAKESAAITREVMELTDFSIAQSSQYIQEVSAKLADPEREDGVSSLERAVIAGAALNNSTNFKVKVLFLQAREDLGSAQALVDYMAEALANAERDVVRLAGTPFAELPKNALKANQRIQALVLRFIDNRRQTLASRERISAAIADLSGKEVESAQSTFALFAGFFERLLVVFLFAALLFIILTTLLTRSIVQPLRATREMLREIACGEGDLTRQLSAAGRDELADLGRNFNLFVEKLRAMIGTIKENALSLSTASNQMLASAEGLHHTTERQSAQSQTVAAAMEEFTTTMEENRHVIEGAAAKVEEMQALATDTAGAIGETVKVVDQIALKTGELARIIEQLGSSAAGIGEIANVINGISDQTGMLALNAAIEAARAGSAGRGFAVVADEVRNLADRTTSSTGEIKEMIRQITGAMAQARGAMETTLAEVTRGKGLADQGQQMLQRVGAAVSAVGEMTASINASIARQAASVGEVNDHVQEIAAEVQHSRHAIHEVAQSANDVALRSESLSALVGRFRTG